MFRYSVLFLKEGDSVVIWGFQERIHWEFNASLWCVNRHSNSSMQTVDATKTLKVALFRK